MAHEKWAQGVKAGMKRRGTEGVFKKAAERAGKSTHEFAESHKHASGKTGRRARLALAFESMRHKK